MHLCHKGDLRAGLTARPLWILRHEVNGYHANLGGNISFTQYQRVLTACTAPYDLDSLILSFLTYYIGWGPSTPHYTKFWHRTISIISLPYIKSFKVLFSVQEK